MDTVTHIDRLEAQYGLGTAGIPPPLPVAFWQGTCCNRASVR